MIPYEIVPVKTAEEIERLAALATEIWHECFAALLSPGQIDYMVERFQSSKAIGEALQSGYRYYCLTANGKPVGYLGIHPEDDRLFLSKIYIHKEVRGQGAATILFDFVKDVCDKEHFTSVYLTVNRHNDHAVAVYRQWKFEIIRTQVTDIGSGYVMDDYVMEYKK